MICGTEDADDMKEKLGELWEEMKELKNKEKKIHLKWNVSVEEGGGMVSLGRRLDDSVKEKLDDWCENKKLDKVKETEGEKSGTVEGKKRVGENKGPLKIKRRWLIVKNNWRCY